jgi:hypothetical protein
MRRKGCFGSKNINNNKGGGKSPIVLRLQIRVALQQQAADVDVAKHSGIMQRSHLPAKGK